MERTTKVLTIFALIINAPLVGALAVSSFTAWANDPCRADWVMITHGNIEEAQYQEAACRLEVKQEQEALWEHQQYMSDVYGIGL